MQFDLKQRKQLEPFLIRTSLNGTNTPERSNNEYLSFYRLFKSLKWSASNLGIEGQDLCRRQGCMNVLDTYNR